LFSKAESDYLKSQKLARIATASKSGIPEVSPVAFEFDGKYFWVGSHSKDIFTSTRRYRNIKNGNTRVHLVVDDLESIDPWKPRAIKISGVAEIMEHAGMFGKAKYIRITPKVTVSWGIEPVKKGKPFQSIKRWS
jgi:pyridoxamine 5'-phosphate oxidase family protein